MKIALTTHGTRGDVQPFVALALALMDRGHDVTLGVPVNLVPFAEKCGVRTEKIAIDTQAFLDSEQGRAWLSSGNVRKFMKELGAINHEHRAELRSDFLNACAGADVLVTGVLTEDYVSSIAEAQSLPMLSVHFNPMRANEAYPNALVTTRSLPGALNRATGTLAEKAWWSAYRDDVNEFRQELGLAKTKQPTARRMADNGWPTLQAYSSTLVPTPEMYGDTMPVLGSIRFPDSARASLGESGSDADLAAWLDAGDPPVFFGLGSMPVQDPAAMVDLVASVTKALGVRAVIGAGWSNLAGHVLADHVRVVGSVDHGWLLPRCRASVHHGGAGTTVAALSAGIPAVVASVFADQPFWGMRIEQVGAGVHLPYRRLDALSLEKALGRVLTPEVAATATRLGDAVQAEADPTATIVARIEGAGA